MEIDQVVGGGYENQNWLLDYGLMMDDVVLTDHPHFTSQPPPQPAPLAPSLSDEIESSFIDFEGPKGAGSRKRLKSESISVCGSKAGREKMRRDRMNERFLELGSILEHGRAPKTDKTAILSDAIRMIMQLRTETKRLTDSNVDLQEKIKELKAEKNELRDEKQMLKVEKEMLEQQVIKYQPASYLQMAHPTTAMRSAFAAQEQAAANKLLPFVGYPASVAMWQFMPSSVVDTSQDHVLRPPVA